MNWQLERRIVAAAQQRLHLDLDNETVGAEDLADAIRNVAPGVGPYGVDIRNGTVSPGLFDLSAVNFAAPLRFRNVEFDTVFDADGAKLHALALVDCRLQSFRANGVDVTRDLDLTASTVSGHSESPASTSMRAGVWLSEARVGGRVLCVGTRLATEGGRAVHADRIEVGGSVRLIHGFEARAEVRLIGARIRGSLDLEGTIEGRAHRALDLGGAIVDGNVFFDSKSGQELTTLRGRIEMGHLSIGGEFRIRNAHLHAAPSGQGLHESMRDDERRLALWAPRLQVRGDLTITGDCDIDGGIDLALCEIGGSFTMRGQSIRNPGGTAIDMKSSTVKGRLTIDSTPDRPSTVEGSVRLSNASIGGTLRLRDTRLSKPSVEGDDPSTARHVVAAGVQIAGRLDLRRLHSDGGGLWFGGAAVQRDVELAGASLSNRDGYSANFRQAEIGGSIIIRRGPQEHAPFASLGLFALNHVVVHGRLQIEAGTFTPGNTVGTPMNRHGCAVEAIGSRFDGGTVLGWQHIEGGADFTGASTTYLADNPNTWGPRIRITGFRYERFAPLPDAKAGSDGVWGVRERAGWLARQHPLDTQPYEHAATVMSARGMHRAAEELLIAGRRHRRRTTLRRGSYRRCVDAAYSGLVGYGHRPGRAVLGLLLLFAVALVPSHLAYQTGVLRATDGTGTVFTADGLIAVPLDTVSGTTEPVVTSAPAGDTDSGPPTGDPDGSDPCGGGRVRCFDAVWYAVDTVVPIVDLGQRSTWRPDTHQPHGTTYQNVFAIITVLGWALSAIGALTFSRLGRVTSTT